MSAGSKQTPQRAPNGLPLLPAACDPLQCPPWAREVWETVYRQHMAGQLHHALLLSGPAGLGKRWLAEFMARALVCEARAVSGPCGTCPPCQQMAAGTLPDFHAVPGDGAGGRIKVDAIRELISWLHLTASGQYRLAVIVGADTLNRSGANSLLKSLEEPGEAGRLILVADRPAALPATVRSRCQNLKLVNADPARALDWLHQAGVAEPQVALALARGAPLLALVAGDEQRQAHEALLRQCWQDLWLGRASVGRLVEQLAALETRRVLTAFMGFSAEAIRASLSADSQTEALQTPDQALAEFEQRLPLEQWFTVYDRILHLYRIDDASFRTQAVLEGLLADMRRISLTASPAS